MYLVIHTLGINMVFPEINHDSNQFNAIRQCNSYFIFFGRKAPILSAKLFQHPKPVSPLTSGNFPTVGQGARGLCVQDLTIRFR